MRTAVYKHRLFQEHYTGEGHPECPDRIKAVEDLLRQEPFCSGLELYEPPRVREKWLKLAHDEFYIKSIKQICPVSGVAEVCSGTFVSSKSMEAALHAAGAVCQAVDDCFTGKIDRAFCAVRPPGHHALAGEAMGFCLFNNAAIGAMYAMSKYGAERIALVDIDVHHGNGTEAFAREHEGIFFISSHQWPLWPGSGRGDDNIEGRILNIPLPPGSGPREFRRAYKEQVFPALEEYGPELILISAGFDAHRDDPLAGLNLMDEDYGWITGNICDIAERHCGGRVISTLEGGYNLDALKRSVAAHLRALMSADNFYF